MLDLKYGPPIPGSNPNQWDGNKFYVENGEFYRGFKEINNSKYYFNEGQGYMRRNYCYKHKIYCDTNGVCKDQVC